MTNASLWMKSEGPEADIVLSSRVRLARNLTDLPFPNRLGDSDGKRLAARLQEAFDGLGNDWQLTYHPLADIPPIERQVLVEKHVVSPALIQEPVRFEGLVADPGESISIMVNEEDHLRMQVFLAGLQLSQAWQMANRLDDDLERNLNFAYDSELGYLTACPTNVGTGLRASVMVHLPALVLTRQVQPLFHALAQIGVVVRGLYGEGTEVVGNLFQVSNQVSLGLTEEEFVHNLTVVAQEIVGRERQARQILTQSHRLEVADRVGRAWGILTHASIISSDEALKLLSEVKLGQDLEFIKVPGHTTFSELALMTRPGYLMYRAGQELHSMERDALRATILRERLISDAEYKEEH